MEGVSGPSSESSSDKLRVYNVKPLRTLVPMFPSPPDAPPFVCSYPFGPFSSGFTPFYPFSMPPGPGEQRPGGSRAANLEDTFASPAGAVPVRSLGDNGDTGSSKKGKASQSNQSNPPKKRSRKRAVASGVVIKPDLSNVAGLPQPQREEGSPELVNLLMMKFDGVRRRLSQLEDSKEAITGLLKRPDLKAGNIMLTAGYRTNTKKRMGPVPGVEIGDLFYFRLEMCVLGLHAQPMGGIDYMTVKGDSENEPLAVSIVSSGGYDDDANDQDVLIYSGQGGGNYSGKGQDTSDQKLERGNLALEKSARRVNEIRVIRGINLSPAIKVYIYDGLYSIQDSWIDKGKSGTSTFKYKLVRLSGQPSAFAVWQSVLKWKEDLTSREGLILPDLTFGAESLPVSLVNDVDNEKGPPFFTYLRSIKCTKSFNLAEHSYVCNCSSACAPGDLNCACIRQNGGDFPYTAHGVLVCRKPLIYECGPSCPCGRNCKNRVSQTGLKVRLEVFKTKDRSWGLRSWDPIRSGTFVCEFAGEVIDKAKYGRDERENNDYIFDTSRSFEKFKWNYDPPLVGEASGDPSEDYNIPTPLVVNAKDSGNVARFMNHSCSPNVFWQPVVYEQNGESCIHVTFFAMRHIPPMTELTYDYGIPQFENRRKRCLCRSSKCRGYFG